MWFNTIKSISSMFALYFLVSYAFFAARIPELKDLKIKSKFYLIKLSMIFTEIQPLIISIFANRGLIANTSDYSPEEITNYTNSLLICSEMIIVGFIQILVFPLSDYNEPPRTIKETLTDNPRERLI